jgi:MFS transporter, PAT family, beta-lactamase induction signal transducer AmpG
VNFKKNLIYRQITLLVLGFASGLPLALSGQAMQAWLTQAGLDLATIGFLSLVALPYTFKFLWAPLMDRFEPPWLGRRRTWITFTQISLAATLWLISDLNPSHELSPFALLIALLAFLSASQDVVIDAYRTDLLCAQERGLGSSMAVFGYRLGMICSGGLAFIWADPASAWGWNWGNVYELMAWIMLSIAALSAVGLEKINANPNKSTRPSHDLLGFTAVLITVAIGALITHYAISPSVLLLTNNLNPKPASKWPELIVLLIGLCITIPAAWLATRRLGFITLNQALDQFFTQKQATTLLIFIVLYKLGDAFAGSISTPFLIKAIGFSQAEIGVVNKIIGIWMTILGALAGGALMMRLSLYNALMLFGAFQMVSNLGFYALATVGRDYLGSLTLPAFNWGVIALNSPTSLDGLLLFAIALENIASGMGTAASATQYALLSAFATIGRVWVGPMAGVIAPQTGWPVFFLLSVLMAIPGLLLLAKLKDRILNLDK